MKVGFVGSGNMAAALARGFATHADGVEMSFSDAGSGRAAELAAEVGGSAAEVGEQAAGSDLLLLAVKPASLGAVASGLGSYRGPVISLLGATKLAELGEALPGRSLLRTMPNVAVEIGRGVICHAPPADPVAMAPALDLLGRVGTLVELPEEQLDAATAVMGCSPAYLAMACGALSAAGEAAGLERSLARVLIAETAAGTGELLRRHDPASIQRAVASPGGSTEAGLEALDERRVGAAFAAAVEASLGRMRGEL